MSGMFDGFTETGVDLGDGVRLRVRAGGSGPVVVLLTATRAPTPPGIGSLPCRQRGDSR